MKRRVKRVQTKAKRSKAKVKFIPDGYHTETPYLIVDNGAAAIEFYKKAFGAKEVVRMESPNRKIGHAEIQIGNSRIMLADESPDMGARGPKAVGGSPVRLMLYVQDVDKVFNQALAEGAKETRPVTNQFYGDRSGMLDDPFGHHWIIATHIEDVSPKEMKKRMQAFAAGTPA
jgi:PhnB protein